MLFENKPCPACGSHFHEGDDIVVCPVCGTPQHRGCWAENGKCVNAEKHEPGYKWGSRIDEPDDAQESETAETGDIIICHVCASENPADISHCGHCGAMLHPENSDKPTTRCIYCGTENPSDHTYCSQCGAPITPFVKDRAEIFRNVTGVEESAIIAGHTAAEYALYVRHGAARYLTRFEKFAGGKVLSFSWAGLIFGFVWLFARKIYKQALIIMLLLAAVWLAVSASPGMQKAQELLMPYMQAYSEGTLTQETAQELSAEMFEAMKIPALIFGLSLLAANIACALFGNRWYFGKIRRDLDMLSAGTPDPQMKSMYLSRRGGLSILSGICGYFIYTFIQQAFLYIAQFFAER